MGGLLVTWWGFPEGGFHLLGGLSLLFQNEVCQSVHASAPPREDVLCSLRSHRILEVHEARATQSFDGRAGEGLVACGHRAHSRRGQIRRDQIRRDAAWRLRAVSKPLLSRFLPSQLPSGSVSTGS